MAAGVGLGIEGEIFEAGGLGTTATLRLAETISQSRPAQCAYSAISTPAGITGIGRWGRLSAQYLPAVFYSFLGSDAICCT